MVSDSQLINQVLFEKNILRELTHNEKNQLKKSLLYLYDIISKVCENNSLICFLGGGSCLGAVRHQGFIPWDDDLDIMMLRTDYNRLIELCEKGALGNQIEFTYPQLEKDSKNTFLKIYLKNTVCRDIFNISGKYPGGISIDIFPIEEISNNKLINCCKGFIANVLEFISILILYGEKNPKLEEVTNLNIKLKKRYRIKKLFGKFFSIIPHKYWVYWFDRLVTSKKVKQKYCIPTGRKYYNGEIYNKNVIFPPTKGIFEQREVNLPNDYDTYLKNLYGDYMKVPPVEKRERHFIYEFRVNKCY